SRHEDRPYAWADRSHSRPGQSGRISPFRLSWSGFGSDGVSLGASRLDRCASSRCTSARGSGDPRPALVVYDDRPARSTLHVLVTVRDKVVGVSFLASPSRSAPEGVGKPVRRREDARLTTGAGAYTDDVNLRGPASASTVRS